MNRTIAVSTALAAWIAAAPLPPPAAAEPASWTLRSATRRALDVAPEQHAAAADVEARAAALRQAESWPNPSVDLRADDKLGQEDGQGGTDLTRAGLSQPLPLRRLARQGAAAEAALRAAQASRRHRQLELEQRAAAAFHALQLAAARRDLAQDRLALTKTYAGGGAGRRDPLVRYLPPLERRRVAILAEEAQQAVLAAQRDHDQAAIEFRALLDLPADAPIDVAPLVAPAAFPGLAALERDLAVHPALEAARHERDAARAAIAVAESQRFADPEIGVFRERDVLNGARRDVTGIALTVQVPLWNLNRGPVDATRALALGAQADLTARERDAVTRLRRSHAELARLTEQLARLHTTLLVPARELLDLTRRAFAVGEADLLALVDANNLYFDTQARHLELLGASALAAANLRAAAGRSVLTPEATP